MGRKKVSFWATKKVPIKKRVSFRTSYGKKVSFTAKKLVPQKKRVSFWATKKRKRR